jgi:hypothetical protein
LIDTEDEAGEILLLDLRLFQAGSPAERAFMASVQQVARRFVNQGAWPLFTRDELDDVKRWAGTGVDDAADRPTLLTLLPRVVAHVDLSLPIVVFSSTGRREVVGRLRGYESVNTRFAKPRFFGDSTTAVDDATVSFDEAIREAAVLLRGRRTIAGCLVDEKPAESGAMGKRYRHAALYLDESETETAFTVGGVLALYADEAQERRFDRALKDSGIHWGADGKPKFVAAGKGSEPEWCHGIVEAAERDGIMLVGVALTANRNEQSDIVSSLIGTGGTPRSLDRLHRTMLRTIIEVVLFHLIPDGEMAERWTFGVCADVRSVPAKRLTHAALKEVREKFGLYAGVFSKKGRELEAKRDMLVAAKAAGKAELAGMLEEWCREDLVEGFRRAEQQAVDDGVTDEVDRVLRARRMLDFVGTDGVLPVVEDVLGQYEGAERLARLRIIEARGCHLPEGGESAKLPENRSLHYWSDWVAGASREHQKGAPLPAWLREITDGEGFNELYDRELRRRVRHARWALRDEAVRAGADLIAMGAPEPSSSRLRRRCASVVASVVAAATDGAVFIDASCRAGALLNDVEREEARGPRSLWVGLGSGRVENLETLFTPKPDAVTQRQAANGLWFAIVRFASSDDAAMAKVKYRGHYRVRFDKHDQG